MTFMRNGLIRYRPFDTVEDYQDFATTHHLGKCAVDCRWCEEDDFIVSNNAREATLRAEGAVQRAEDREPVLWPDL